MKDLWKLFIDNVGVIFGEFEKPRIDIWKSFFVKSFRFRINDGKPEVIMTIPYHCQFFFRFFKKFRITVNNSLNRSHLVSESC